MSAETFKEIFDICIRIVVLILGGFLIPYIKGRIGQARYNKILEWVDIGVNAAEQIYKTMDKSDEKNILRYEYVVDFLNKKNVKITEDEMRALIESAVLSLEEVIK